ncbi:MAG TPA: cupin domain-containing protein [Actinomycetota bacterium]
MEQANLTDHVHFEESEVARSALFESERLFSQLLCLSRNQSYGPASDPDSDAMLTVLAGEAAFQVGKRRARLKQWGAVLIPAGADVTVKNASADPLVVLMVTAPPPAG